MRRYKVEPYVVAADIYSMPPHVGRGGWTWYTGSAGWIYRAGLESILGFRLQGNQLLMNPCIPSEWPGFTITFRYHSSRYKISIENPGAVSTGVVRATVDDSSLTNLDGGATIPLVDDGQTHSVHLTLG
jgi:cyclic beta-1,2-glucan synthetase